MAGKAVNSSFVLLSKFGASRQGSALKIATSHIRKPLTLATKVIAKSNRTDCFYIFVRINN